MSCSLDKDQVKICVLTSVHPPFDGRIFHREAKTLTKAGYHVVLIAQHSKEEFVDGVKILALPKPRNRLERMTKVVWKLFRLALKEKADVYHFHDPELIPVGLVLKLLGKKTIWDVHEHYPNSILDKFWISGSLRRIVSRSFDLLEKMFVPLFDYVIYTTAIVGERYNRMKVPAGQIENYPKIELSEAFKKNPQKNVIYLGAMTKIRGIIELIKAFAVISKKYPRWRLYMVGKASPPSFGKEIEELISELALRENIKLIPWVPYEEKERFSSEASIGIVTYLPYSNNTSCLPNKLFEYMLVGLPVIASNFPLYREVVDGNNCGLIVDPSKPEEIAEAIEYLIKHPEEARKMGENGREAVLEKYNWEKESKKLLAIYERVLSNNGG
jgi:glycosyltransferase involved in cell wall biosynthesis